MFVNEWCRHSSIPSMAAAVGAKSGGEVHSDLDDGSFTDKTVSEHKVSIVMLQ
jgi:hypothetical protein